MTRIDFYFNAPDRIDVACRITQKAVQQKLRVLIFAPHDQTLARIDRQLWIQPPTGFIPHCLASAPNAPETPVLLTREVDDPPHDEVLVNLHDERPASFARFTRLIEIVSQDEADRERARERFRFYKDRGYEIHRHDLAAAGGAG